MLNTLRSIVQDVAGAGSFREQLELLVHDVRVALGTDGFVADMGAERDAGIALGEPPDIMQARLDAGRALLSAHFDADSDVVREIDGAVREVVVAGQTVVRDGVLQTADLDDIRREAQDAATELWRRMEAL